MNRDRKSRYNWARKQKWTIKPIIIMSVCLSAQSVSISQSVSQPVSQSVNVYLVFYVFSMCCKRIMQLNRDVITLSSISTQFQTFVTLKCAKWEICRWGYSESKKHANLLFKIMLLAVSYLACLTENRFQRAMLIYETETKKHTLHWMQVTFTLLRITLAAQYL